MSYTPLEKTHSVIDGAVSTITTKKEFFFKQIINVILIFVILVVFGCLDFATLEFHIERLQTLSYWTTVFTKLVASICALNIGINLMLDLEIKKDLILAQAIEIYNKLNKIKGEDFEYFITHVYNVNAKKKAYISQINRSIFLLNRFSRRKDRLLYSSDLPEMQEKKLKNRYCIKRAELEELKSDAFIDKNINSLNVKYKDIDPAIFELEIDGSAKVHQSKVRGSVNAGRAKATSTTILTCLAFSMVATGFTLTADQEEFENNMVECAHYMMKAAEDIGIIAWQLFRGAIMTRGIVSSQLTVPYVNRNNILKAYYRWREKNGKSVPLAYKELTHDETEDEYIELTPEELEKIKTKEKTE